MVVGKGGGGVWDHGGRERGGGMGFIATYLAQRPSWS